MGSWGRRVELVAAVVTIAGGVYTFLKGYYDLAFAGFVGACGAFLLADYLFRKRVLELEAVNQRLRLAVSARDGQVEALKDALGMGPDLIRHSAQQKFHVSGSKGTLRWEKTVEFTPLRDLSVINERVMQADGIVDERKSTPQLTLEKFANADGTEIDELERVPMLEDPTVKSTQGGMHEFEWRLKRTLQKRGGRYRKRIVAVVKNTFDFSPEEELNVDIQNVGRLLVEVTFADSYLKTMPDKTGDCVEAVCITHEYGRRSAECERRTDPDGSLTLRWEASPGIHGEQFRLTWPRPDSARK